MDGRDGKETGMIEATKVKRERIRHQACPEEEEDMQLSNCSGCGKLQLNSSPALCKDCFKQHLDRSHRVKAFLTKNPRASLMDVCHHTGLSLRVVNEVVRRA
ncbi:hypothetical protein SAMN02799630_05095 [Paenibacillus sp. UNCCL117]|nr:hypothetical protein SAMN04488602_12463 [Paenibacillus sp. cl123]SFW63134.1 hypothetical protein SAMN02799630_05095 [Paenibacillus sp. UNCCL117]